MNQTSPFVDFVQNVAHSYFQFWIKSTFILFKIKELVEGSILIRLSYLPQRQNLFDRPQTLAFTN